MHTDPLWMKVFLTVHVSAGMVSFILAPVALATAKGGTQHRRWGMVYLWSMGVVSCTALPMALFRPVLFLALVSVVSAYLAFSGYRVLKLKDLASGGSARPIDWVAACVALAGSVSLVALGWLRPAAVQHMQVVAILLGSLGTRGIIADLWRFVRRPTDKMFWWYSHLTKFIASYIAAWTAFSTATLSHFFRHAGIILWLWPAAIGVPAIVLTTAYYKRKFAARKPPTLATGLAAA
ncbi:hypothetical protein AciX9_4700 (plasmid) [Granulicella tundricola MP5ACTX9]|uniref:DUF2306 domain-containing protein n=2 Tax=Granulicella TaxID=940557 RepID=E8X843_GRATM|nr:hypothetical protein AciX9_4700 [Granulicella tundricola MP5ACTX9]